MTLRIITNVLVAIGKDASMNTTYYDNTEDEAQNQQIIDKFTCEVTNRVQLGAAEQIDIDFGSLTDIRGIFMLMDAQCTVAINDQQPFTMMPGDPAADNPNCKFFMEGKITHVVITSGPTTPVNCDFAAWGYQTTPT